MAIDAIGAPGFVPLVLDYLRANTAFVGAFAVLLVGREAPRHIYDNVRAERRAAVIDSYLDGAYLLDPFYSAYQRSGATRVVRLGEVAPDRFHQTAYFRTYYASTKLKDEMALFVEIDATRSLFYSIGRRADERAFTRREELEIKAALPIFAALNRRHMQALDHLAQHEQKAKGADRGDALDRALHRLGAQALTRREREVAEQILKGHSTKAIASHFAIATGTVKNHRKKIYQKLGISSQSALFTLFLGAVTLQEHR